MEDKNNTFDINFAAQKEGLVDMIKKELNQRQKGEISRDDMVKDIKALLIGYSNKHKLLDDDAESDYVAKKIDEAADSIADAVRWERLTQKMLKLQQRRPGKNENKSRRTQNPD